MAAPDISMPSFDITNAEKAENVDRINSLLHQCGSLLESYGRTSSAFDLGDASFAVQDALFMANDPDACESPPLAKCYLYQGYVLEAMKKYTEARDAYQKAARISPRSFMERAASETAAGLVVQMEDKIQDGERKGDILPDINRGSALRLSRVQSPCKCENERLRTVSPRYTSPLVQEVSIGRGVYVEKPLLHSLSKPQQLVQCDEGWAAEIVSAPTGTDEDKDCQGMGMGMRWLVPDTSCCLLQ
ncbi:hypothetical protein F4776DRAFT_642339 [Hypoxylon sp. NC0597]|nr:hypothetical protein F4776DRAFT_642339 [Hypoxylon sp. NC0597]